MPKKHCVVIPFSCLVFFFFSALYVIVFARDDVTRKYCSVFSFVKSNEDYGVLATTYCIIIIVITIAGVA